MIPAIPGRILQPDVASSRRPHNHWGMKGDANLPPKRKVRNKRLEKLITTGVDVKLLADLAGSRTPLLTALYYVRASKSKLNAAVAKSLDAIKAPDPESR